MEMDKIEMNKWMQIMEEEYVVFSEKFERLFLNVQDEPDSELVEDCLSILNKRYITNYLLKLANQTNQNLTEDDNDYITNLAVIAHSLIFHQQESILRSK